MACPMEFKVDSLNHSRGDGKVSDGGLKPPCLLQMDGNALGGHNNWEGIMGAANNK